MGALALAGAEAVEVEGELLPPHAARESITARAGTTTAAFFIDCISVLFNTDRHEMPDFVSIFLWGEGNEIGPKFRIDL
ncbi:hypothetical protein [Paraburkholderia humisilvae]|uniref:hypothetical protein n=1 Tax=Paraburkholderia humisilvae TaxID=627669 RepID=UPI001582EA1D|nr:hypothetical protein [Paraburkholderia humisilvae]